PHGGGRTARTPENRHPRQPGLRGRGIHSIGPMEYRRGHPESLPGTRLTRQGATKMHIDRRELLKLLGFGGVVLGSGLPRFSLAASKGKPAEDFMFLQLSDSHWGFSGPPNPAADRTLKEAVQAVNASKVKPD